MLNRLFAAFLVYAFTFNAIANVNPTLQSVLLKYEYALTAHPSAHLSDFRAENIEKMKEAITQYASNVSKEDLEKEFKSIVNKIPSKEKRSDFLELIKSSTKEELSALAANEALLLEAFRGESSNFSVNDGIQAYHVIYAVTIGLFLYLFLSSSNENSNYDFFSSRVVWVDHYSSFDWYVCTGTELFPYEAELLRNEARNNCLSHSPNPETCEFAGYSASTNDPVFEWSNRYTCVISALYRSQKLEVTQ